jgi:hypothetical protein
VPNWRGLLPARKEGDVERGMGDLPYTEAELIRQCQREYETAAEHGGQDALDACFRWVACLSGLALESPVQLACTAVTACVALQAGDPKPCRVGASSTQPAHRYLELSVLLLAGWPGRWCTPGTAAMCSVALSWQKR